MRLTLMRSWNRAANWLRLALVHMLGGVMVRTSDVKSRGSGFASRPFRCQATLGKLLIHVSLLPSIWNLSNLAINIIMVDASFLDC